MERMTGSELWAERERLGLLREDLARLLSVREATVRRWEVGKDPIPVAVREELAAIAAVTDETVEQLIAELRTERAPRIVVYRQEHEPLPEKRANVERFGVSWWRAVAARAAARVPGTRIGTRAEFDALGGTPEGAREPGAGPVDNASKA
ncbi:hypothetical protein GCM10028784_29790 [Myceligenerans cantabricum]